MIDAAVAQIAHQLNLAMRRSLRAADDLVVVSNLHEQDGTVSTTASNKLAVFLVNIERETMPFPPRQPAPATVAGARIGVVNAPVHLNLLLMFAANFSGSNYPEALKFIAATIAFFQSRPVLDHHNTPELDPRIDRLTLEIENLSLSDLSNLWGILSGKYLPSIAYRVRMVTIDADQLDSQVPTVSQPRIGVHP
jgi:hypothetical protein